MQTFFLIKKKIPFSFLLILLILNSCGSSKDKRWITTEEGIEYFLPEDKKPSFLTLGKYYWSGDSIAGLAYGPGELRFEDSWNSNENFTIKGFARFGAILPENEENLYFIGPTKNYLLDGYATKTKNDTTIIANFKKGVAKGIGKIYKQKELIYSGKLKNSLPDGSGKLYENGQLIYDGNFKEGLYNGNGELFYLNGNIHYHGDFKKGIFDGEGTLYFPNGALLYRGGFKNGLFHGTGEINYPLNLQDSIGYKPTDLSWILEMNESPALRDSLAKDKYLKSRNLNVWINEKHVFENGKVKPLHFLFYDNLNDKSTELKSETYIKIYNRINSWETNAWWKYLIIIAILGIFWIVLLIVFDVEDFKDYSGKVRENAALYSRIKKWSCWQIYPIWLLFGWFGFHRAELKSMGAFIYGGLFSLLVLLNLRNIVLFLFWPSSWVFMNISLFSIVITGCILLFWLIDIAWIPWRCYWLNHTYYRHDLREKELISTTKTDVDKLVYDIKPKIKGIKENLNGLLNQTKTVQSQKYIGKTSSFNLKRIVGVTFGNDKWAEFELDRLKSLESLLKDYTRTQDKFAEFARNLNIYLEEARKNAYRNINLAKELIGWLRKIKTQGTILEKDRELHSNYSTFDFSSIQMPEINLGVDFDSTCKQCVKTTNLLMTAGLRLGPSLAIGAALSLVNHIADALQKAQRLCEEANEKSRLAVKGIGESLDNIVKSEADILRAYEILSSLNKANKAFIQIYVPLRDAYTGCYPSFGYFIRGGVRIPERNYREDFIHLQQVTSEYNKINKAKL